MSSSSRLSSSSSSIIINQRRCRCHCSYQQSAAGTKVGSVGLVVAAAEVRLRERVTSLANLGGGQALDGIENHYQADNHSNNNNTTTTTTTIQCGGMWLQRVIRPERCGFVLQGMQLHSHPTYQ
jgi:hypothetical protein